MSERTAMSGNVAPPRTPLGLRLGFWVCFVIGVVVVVRRAVVLSHPAASGGPTDMVRLDAWFRMHTALTWLHILTALAFLMLTLLVLWSRTRGSAMIRRGFYMLGLMVVLTAYAMSAYSVGGWVERSAVFFFNTFFAVAMGISFHAWRAGMAARERRWTLRSVAIVLGIATTRPVMGVFFATSRLSHWTPEQFFGFAFWIGFSINVIVMELYLRRAPTPAERYG